MVNQEDLLIKHIIDNFKDVGDSISYREAQETFHNEVEFGEIESEDIEMKDYTESNGEFVEIPEIVNEFFTGVNMIKVLLVKPKKTPEIIEIGSDLESMQEIVGGYIEEMMPFEEEVAIVCNSEDKILKLDLSRAIRDQNGLIFDIIAGSFFVCSTSGENFGSLSEEQLQRYYKIFERPECFYLTCDGIKAIPVIPLKAKR